MRRRRPPELPIVPRKFEDIAMPLPPRPFHTLSDIANRWSVVPIDLVGWAAEGLLALSFASPPAKTDSSRIICDLLEIAGTDVLPLFRSDATKVDTVQIRRVRPHGETEWLWISEPAFGIPIGAPDVLIMRAEVQRFELHHGLSSGDYARTAREPARNGRRRAAGPGAPPRYDWDTFFATITRRVYADGLPSSQNELVREMLDWFHARHDQNTPDESTVRRKVALVWRELNRS
jgi:hypothetical protein